MVKLGSVLDIMNRLGQDYDGESNVSFEVVNLFLFTSFAFALWCQDHQE